MRGTVVGESVNTRAMTDEARETLDRVYGADRKPQRGKWVMDPATGKLTPADEYVPPHVNPTLMVVTDRYMEGTVTTDGVDIGNRQKRREYMRVNGLADRDDFSPAYREQVKKDFEKQQDRERHAALKRAIYEHKERARNKR